MAIKLEPNAELIPGYKLVKFLGRGGFGEVWECTVPGGISKAMKIAPIPTGANAPSSRELNGLQLMRSIRHPFVLSLERFEQIDTHLIVIMELADKNLGERYKECTDKKLPGIPRDELIGYMKECAEALDVLSNQYNLQHLDIKPENIFLISGHVKIADFGLVHQKDTSIVGGAVCVSPPYAPPELFDGRVESTADQYSLAVTYQEMLTGSRPYAANDIRGLLMQHLRGKPDFSRLSSSDRPIVNRALSRESSQRFQSCVEFVQSLDRSSVFGTTASPWTPTPQAAPVPTKSLPSPGSRPSMGSPSQEQLRQMYVPGGAGKQAMGRTPSTTVAFQRTSVATQTFAEVQMSEQVVADERITETFIAFLPLEVYAEKLRGFIEELDPEIVSVEETTAVLRFRSRGWLGFKSRQSTFLKIDACSRTSTSGYRVVEASVWGSVGHLQGAQLAERAMIILSVLKSFLMAEGAVRGNLSTTELRAQVYG